MWGFFHSRNTEFETICQGTNWLILGPKNNISSVNISVEVIFDKMVFFSAKTILQSPKMSKKCFSNAAISLLLFVPFSYICHKYCIISCSFSKRILMAYWTIQFWDCLFDTVNLKLTMIEFYLEIYLKRLLKSGKYFLGCMGYSVYKIKLLLK